MNRSGNIVDIVLQPLFVTVVALGIVLLVILRAIYGIGSSVEFEKGFYAMDVALLMDSLYAVRPDVNFVFSYSAPKDFGFQITSKKVTVYKEKPEDGKIFWFAEDPSIRLSYGSFPPKRKDGAISFFKSGNSLGVSGRQPSLVAPYCEGAAPKLSGNVASDVAYLRSMDKQVVDLVTGGVLIKAMIKQGDPIVKVYAKNTQESIQLACRIVERLFGKVAGLEGFAIVPVEKLLLSNSDPLFSIASADTGVFIELSVKAVDDVVKGAVVQSVQGEVSSVVV